MAITWSQKDIAAYNKGQYDCWSETGEVTHEGLVIRTYSEDRRVMSDIWSIERFALVWNPETNSSESVHIGGAFECNTRSGDAVVDILPEYLAIHEAQEEAARIANEEYQRKAHEERARKRALAAHNYPERGKVMRVVRGRKVPKGTTGKVFWVNGGRVGLALSDEKDERGRHKDVAWVDSAYLENTAPLPV